MRRVGEWSKRGSRLGVRNGSIGRRAPRRSKALLAIIGAVATLVIFPGLSGATPTDVPAVTTEDASSVTGTSATLNGTVNPNDTDAGADYTFSWGTDTSYSNTPLTGTSAAGTSAQSVSGSLTGLTPGTTYHYQLCATNSLSVSPSCGADKTLTTADAPVATTGSASSIGQTSATLGGTVNPNGDSTSYHFEYGTSSGGPYTSTSSASAGSDRSDHAVQVNVTSLLPLTTYYYRLCASNTYGSPCGDEASFTTHSPPPVVTTSAATNVTSTGATLNGSVNPKGDTTNYTFNWGTTSGNLTNSTTADSAGNGTTAQAVSKAISGLSPTTTYYFQLCATNGSGTSCGAQLSFTTPDAPTVTTGSATSITPTTATLGGTINPNGSSTTYTFKWGTSSGGPYGSNSGSDPAGAGTTAQPISKAISGLSPHTTYYFVLCATNGVGTTCGAEHSFFAPDQPTSVTGTASAITTNGATLSGTVNPNGANVTQAYFQYGLNTSYGATWNASPSPGSGMNAVSVQATLTGLQSGTFHYRLCAINTWGTGCGADQTFTTNAPPTAVLKENPTAPAGLAVSFNGAGSSDADGSIVSWTLNFGDGSHLDGTGAPGADIQHTYSTAGSYSATLTVTDNQGAATTSSPLTVVLPSISVADVSMNEGNSGTTNAVFTITLSAVSTHDISVDYATADGTATAGSDYVALQGTRKIPAGTACPGNPVNPVCQITVQVNGDTIYESNETYTLNLSNQTGASMARGTATGTIVNDDTPPVLIINDGATREGNTGSKVAGSQSWSAGGNLNLADASGFPDTFGAHTFYVSTPGLSSLSTYTYTGVSGNSLTGVEPAGSVADGQIAFQPRKITLTVLVCDVSSGSIPSSCHATTSGLDITVKYSTSDGQSLTHAIPVVQGQDYIGDAGTLTIPAGSQKGQLTFLTIPNTTPEYPADPSADLTRWFTVGLDSPRNATVRSGLSTATIIEDDVPNPPAATTGDPATIGTNNATVSASVTTNGKPTDVYVQYGTTDSYGSQTATTSLSDASGGQSLSFGLTGLAPGTTYHYQVVATHADGATGYGKDKVFTTDRVPTAVLRANKAGGSTPLTVTFDGSSSSDPDGSIASWTLDFGDGSSASGTGAVPSAIAHTYKSPCACIAALTVTDNQGAPSGPATVVVNAAPAGCTVNCGGPPPPPNYPELKALSLDAISATAEKAVVTVDPRGADTQIWIEYGKSESYGAQAKAQTIAAGAVRVLPFTLTGLTPGTIYHYRIVARHTGNTNEMTVTTDKTFTTPKAKAMAVTVQARSFTASSSGTISVPLSCTGNSLARCKGQALLELGNSAVGFASFSVRPKHRVLVRIALKKSALTQVLAGKTLHLDLTISVQSRISITGLSTKPITVLPPPRKK